MHYETYLYSVCILLCPLIEVSLALYERCLCITIRNSYMYMTLFLFISCTDSPSSPSRLDKSQSSSSSSPCLARLSRSCRGCSKVVKPLSY